MRDKKEQLLQLKEALADDLAQLESLKESVDIAQEQKAHLQTLENERTAIHLRNEKALFPGMDSKYEVIGLNSFVLIDENGYPQIFEIQDKKWICKDSTRYLYLVKNGNNFKLIARNGIVKDFDSAGFLIRITDLNNNTVTINRNNEEKITTIETSFGEKYRVEYLNGFISKITNVRSSDENIVYSYKNDKLEKVTDTDGDSILMEYDEAGHLTKVKKCDNSSISFLYERQRSDGQRLTTRTVNEEGFSEYFDYEINNKKTIYKDHDGNTTVYYFDDRNRTIRKLLPDGTVIINEYDDKDNLIRTDENGSITRYFYDEQNNIIRVSYPDGSDEQWTYDQYGNITSYKNRDKIIETYYLDSSGNLKEYLRAGKLVYSQQVNSKGLVQSRTYYGQNPLKTVYTYDSFGNLTSETNGGITDYYEYDTRNRVTKVKRNGNLLSSYSYQKHQTVKEDYTGLRTTVLTNGRKDIIQVVKEDTKLHNIQKFRFVYDKRHLPVKLYAGDDKSEKLYASYLYSPEGNLTAEILHGTENWITLYEYQADSISKIAKFKTQKSIDLSGNTPLITYAENGQVYTQKYNYRLLKQNGKQITVTDPLGIQNIYEYDFNKNLIKATAGNGDISQLAYSKAGLLISEQSAYGGIYRYSYNETNSGCTLTAGEDGQAFDSIDYYPDGSIKTSTDKCGIKITYNYDNRGRVISQKSDKKKIWYEYDYLDRIVKVVYGNTSDEKSAVYFVNYAYSQDGRSLQITEGGKYKTENQFDAFGNLICRKDGNNNSRNFSYDYLNHLTAETDAYGNQTLYNYNALDQIVQIILPDETEVNYSYNYMGLLEKITDAAGVYYTAEYDKAGHLIKEQTRAEAEKTYKYDAKGRVTEIRCADELIQSYSYQNRGRKVTATDGKGEKYFYSYDGFGRLTGEKNRVGNVQSYVYDRAGELQKKIAFDGNQMSLAYSDYRNKRTVNYSDGTNNQIVFDAIENIKEAQNQNDYLIFEYDQGGRLIYQKNATTDEEIRYEYDLAGNRIRLLSATRDTNYSYGKNNELKEIFDNKQKLSIKLDYNKTGQEVLRKFGNGTREETHYDRAGRVILKTQKADNNMLLWAEGYIYGSDGKQTATVNNNGQVTLYEYNKKGELSAVYYPYTQELINQMLKEAESNGLQTASVSGENHYLTSEEKSAIIPLLNSMQNGLAYKLTNLQTFIKQSFTYDKNGNRISKTTPLGTIQYFYDKENCLISSGSKNQSFINYEYDKAGNLISEEGANKSVRYSYNPQNRLALCEVLNKEDNSYTQTAYTYDAFGRRIVVQDKGTAALRTLYDGFTFEAVKQAPVYASGLFTDSTDEGSLWNNSGKPTGDRYRYLDEDEASDGNRYFYLDDDVYKNVSTRYLGERTQFYVNGGLAIQTTRDSGPEYFTTDLPGSIRSTTDSYGSQKSTRTYDSFGSIIQGSLSGSSDTGYLGKSFDPTSALYNYGFRDYNPSTSRFTTLDPLRDGHNWFLYCNNDPVNFIDPNGFFFYTANGQQSITSVKKTTVDIIRNDNGLGNSFNATRYIYKNDGITTKLVYVDTVGANCSKENYDGKTNTTSPDGVYYLSTETVLQQKDDTYVSKSYENVLALKTNDEYLSAEQRDIINIGDRLFHANQFKNSRDPYNSNETPGSAGCIIGKDGQKHQNEMMAVLMDGVDNPESIVVRIRSFEHIKGCGK